MHVIAAKAVAIGEALRPEFKTICISRRDQRQSYGKAIDGAWFFFGVGWHRLPPHFG